MISDPQPIFDESAPDSILLHKWANALHIVTRPFIIEERLPFAEGDEVNLADLAEAEAILRRERYIADARVQVADGCATSIKGHTVSVTTQDNWSLIPTFSFSRSGGENNTIIGVREDNFLGYGIRTRLRYSSDEQRSGYQLGFSSAVHLVKHANVHINLEDNDDGDRYQFIFDKPFFHLGTSNMQFVEVLDDQRVEDIFQNGDTRNSLNVTNRLFRGAYGWSLESSELLSRRIMTGIEIVDTDFSFNADSLTFNPIFLPENRSYQYPWVAYEYIERNIVVLRDIRLIQQPEDINFGWYYRAQFGLETNDVRDGSELGYHLSAQANTAFKFKEWVFLFNANMRAILNTTAKDFVRVGTQTEAFYRQNDILGYYGRVTADFSTGQFLDQPIVLDDDTGVRGYPNQYQHGEHRVSASVEARFYTNYNIYQLFEVGFATFFDIGRAYQGDTANFNEDDSIISSVGLGARFFSNKASNPGVVHLDVTKPLGDGDGIDNIEWSMQFRRSF